MKKSVKSISAILGIIIITLLSWNCISLKIYNQILQRNIDSMFKMNFSYLCGNLNIDYENLSDEELSEYSNKIEKYTYLMSSIFSKTSYSGDQNLNEIVLTLSNLCNDFMYGENKIYKIMTEKLRDDLNYLCYRLNYDDVAELSEAVWNELKSLISKS